MVRSQESTVGLKPPGTTTISAARRRTREEDFAMAIPASRDFSVFQLDHWI